MAPVCKEISADKHTFSRNIIYFQYPRIKRALFANYTDKCFPPVVMLSGAKHPPKNLHQIYLDLETEHSHSGADKA